MQSHRLERGDLFNLTAYTRANPDNRGRVVGNLQRQIVAETIGSRGIKGLRQYGLFFFSMLVHSAVDPKGATIIKSAYLWFRHVDDVADGDKPLPARYLSKEDFLQSKYQILNNLIYPDGTDLYGEREDLLALDYFQKARRMGITLGAESLAILETIMFDEERARLRRVPTRNELNDYFEKLDFACIGGALKTAQEPHGAKALNSLSWAVRTMFNLRDLPKDLRDGIINIPQEDLDEYGIDLTLCTGQTLEELLRQENLARWYREQLRAGKDYLVHGREEVKSLKLKLKTRAACKFLFINPSESNFTRIDRLLQTAA